LQLEKKIVTDWSIMDLCTVIMRLARAALNP
jgi:hypothetical protein